MCHHLGRLCGAVAINHILLTLLFAFLPSFSFGSLYTIDPHQSQLEFTWSYGGLIDDTARADAMHGHVHLHSSKPELSDVRVTIHVADIKTGDAGTDALLYGESFFDSKRFPTITFISDRAATLDYKPDDDNPAQHQISGYLTMHGVTKPVALEISLSDEDRHALKTGHTRELTLTAQTTLNRTDFNMTDYAGIIGESVSISITTHLKKLPPAAAASGKPLK